MNSLFKIVAISAACGAPLVASCGGGGSAHFVGEEDGGSVFTSTVQKSAQPKLPKQQALDDVRAIISSRYVFNRALLDVLNDGGKSMEEKIKYLGDECGYEVERGWLQQIVMGTLPSGTTRDLGVYEDAQRIITENNLRCAQSQSSEGHLESALDELYVFFSLYLKKEQFYDAQTVGSGGNTQNLLIESNYITSIVGMLEPHVSSQAALFSSCLSLESDGQTGFNGDRLVSAKHYEANELLLPESIPEFFSAILSAHNTERKLQEYLAKEERWDALRTALDDVGAANRSSLVDMRQYATTFYRNVAPALVALNAFYEQENAKRSGWAIANQKPDTGVGGGTLSTAALKPSVSHAGGVAVVSDDGDGCPSQQDLAKKKRNKKKKEKQQLREKERKAAGKAALLLEALLDRAEESDDESSSKDDMKTELSAAEGPVAPDVSSLLSVSSGCDDGEALLQLGTETPLETNEIDQEKSRDVCFFPSAAQGSDLETPQQEGFNLKARTYDKKASKKKVGDLSARAEKVEKAAVCAPLAVPDRSWIASALGLGETHFVAFTTRVAKDLGTEMITRGNNFIFLFNSMLDGTRQAITGHVPHGSQLSKRFPAWKLAFKKALTEHLIITK